MSVPDRAPRSFARRMLRGLGTTVLVVIPIAGLIVMNMPQGDAAASSDQVVSSSSSCPPSSMTISSGAGCFQHYVVNTEAWIPFSTVVDPDFLAPTPYLLTQASPIDLAFDPNCYTPPRSAWSSTEVSSVYLGDGHTAFGGGYRLRTEISFDFDPATGKISNFTQDAVPAFGTSHRYKVYTSDGKVLATCTQSGNTVNTQTVQQVSSNSFVLGYSGSNPLAKPYAPPASAAISGTVAQDGTLTLSYKTTRFPSQGIQVTISGAGSSTVVTDVENDVSCLGSAGVTGALGLVNLTRGLLSSESGSVTINPNISSSESNRSSLC
jgi:hypothetical protein